MKQEFNVMLAVVQNRGSVVSWGNPEIVLAAITNRSSAIQFASRELQDNEYLIHAALSHAVQVPNEGISPYYLATSILAISIAIIVDSCIMQFYIEALDVPSWLQAPPPPLTTAPM